MERLNAKIPRFVKHLLFWLAYTGFFTLVYGSFQEEYLLQLKIQLLMLPVKLLATYLTLYVLMPSYFFKGRYGYFITLLLIIILLSGFTNWAIAYQIERPLFFPEQDWGDSLFYPAKILKYTTSVYPVVAIAVLVKFLKYWYNNQQATQKLNQEKLEAELKFLKAQIHPHFLFNTLNNLYALSLKKSESAPEVILRLSDLLNYMLYECNVPFVPLAKEIALIENYLALEKIRYGPRLNLSFEVSVDTHNLEIPPLLLLPFIENSFKHGVSGETGKSKIRISLMATGYFLRLSVENSKSTNGAIGIPEVLQARSGQDYKKGIGLQNVRRRLELLFRGKHELRIVDGQSSYQVDLKINLQEMSVNPAGL